MEQLAQKLKDGTMKILEAPIPSLREGHLLVRNHYSLVSAGTEGSTVKAARKGYIGKARERPKQVKQVIDTLKTQGPVQTYRAVMKKLDAFSPLGYSCAGEVIDMAPDVNEFKIGDYVACGGLTACHAEIVAVPKNLCVRLHQEADLRQAAYNTLGSIALQGVRQANLRLGETCAIIGMGLLGQLTALLLRASGVRVIGIDIDTAMVQMGKKHCLDLALNRKDPGIDERIMHFSGGIGCDAVIIAAASSSLDPINFAGVISRKRGTIVILGAVPTGFDREPDFYKKELQVKMSCSYGPGRYDPFYEEKGHDYPAAYVRWTENRNMQAFQDLVYTGKIDVGYLTTHTFALEEAPKAYDMMMAKSEPFVGILVKYDVQKELERSKSRIKVNTFRPRKASEGVKIGFVGAGSYAQSHLLPNIPKNGDVQLKGVVTASSASARSVAQRFGFEFCTGDVTEILDNQDINTVFIATRHDSHGKYVLKALEAGKHVFVEKPLCLTREELEKIVILYDRVRSSGQRLMVGYNRRFSPLAHIMKEYMGNGPVAMIYRINAGFIPMESWIQDPDMGGGRVIGEVCHFVDFLTFINGSLPKTVYATVMEDPRNLNDVVNISLTYQNGSIGAISYLSNGGKSLPKERVEIFGNGNSVILDDYKKLGYYFKDKKKEKKLFSQDKGQAVEVRQFIEAVRDGKPELIPFKEIYSASVVAFKVLESIRTGTSVKV
jgi:polar amino acid transport system substrate-binding protein